MESLEVVEELRRACTGFLANMSVEQAGVFLSMFSADEIKQAHANLAPDIQERVRERVDYSAERKVITDKSEVVTDNRIAPEIERPAQIKQEKPAEISSTAEIPLAKADAETPEILPELLPDPIVKDSVPILVEQPTQSATEKIQAVSAELAELRLRVDEISSVTPDGVQTDIFDTGIEPPEITQLIRTQDELEQRAQALSDEANLSQTIRNEMDTEQSAPEPERVAATQVDEIRTHKEIELVQAELPSVEIEHEVLKEDTLSENQVAYDAEPLPPIDLQVEQPAELFVGLDDAEQENSVFEEMELPELALELPLPYSEQPFETVELFESADAYESEPAYMYSISETPGIQPDITELTIELNELFNETEQLPQAVIVQPEIHTEEKGDDQEFQETRSDTELLEPYRQALYELVMSNEPLEPELSEALARLQEMVTELETGETELPKLTEQVVEDIVIILTTLGCNDPVKLLRKYAEQHTLPELFAELKDELPDFVKLIDYQQHLLQALSQATARSDRRQMIAQLLRDLLFVPGQVATQAA